MHPHEEATIRAFFSRHRRTRWLESLASTARREEILEDLNHCRDLDDRYATLLPSNTDIVKVLKAHGAPNLCHVLSATSTLDGCDLDLSEAISLTHLGGWGTIICCLPGQLAYYYDECGERRMLLERPQAK